MNGKQRALVLGFCLALASCNDNKPAIAVENDVLEVQGQLSKPIPEITAPQKSPGTDYGKGLCAKSEAVIFSCAVKNGKTISVCEKVVGDGQKFAQYRYGERDKAAELVWPLSHKDGSLKFATVPYSGGGEGQIAFTRGQYQYVAFSRMVRTNFEADEPNNPAIVDGVIVLRGGKISQIQKCDDIDPMPVQYGLAEKLMGREDELFTYETEQIEP